MSEGFELMKQFVIRNLWWLTLILALLMLIAHTLGFDRLKIDSTSIILLLVIFLSPLLSAIRKIRFGDFEAEIDPKEIQRIKDEVSTSLPEAVQPREPVSEVHNEVSNIMQLVESDAVIALAKLRIELEKVLKKLYRLTHKQEPKRKAKPIGQLVHELSTKEILPQELLGSLRNVITICNRAVHGEEIRQEDARSIVEIGTLIIASLYLLTEEYTRSSIEQTPIDSSTLREFEDARYQLTTVTPYTENPVKNVRIVDQEALDEFLEGYHEFAEFIVEVKKLDSEGNT